MLANKVTLEMARYFQQKRKGTEQMTRVIHRLGEQPWDNRELTEMERKRANNDSAYTNY